MPDQRFQTISNKPLEVQISGNKYLKADCIVSVTKTTHITMFKEIVTLYGENHFKHMDTVSGQNAEIFYVIVHVTYSNHCFYKIKIHTH
jgi:hypothetical protein